MTRERISRILELREMHLSFQTSFNLVNADVVSAILESISGLDLSSDANEPRFLKLVTVSTSVRLFDLFVDAAGVVCHPFGLISTNMRAIGCRGFLETVN